MQKQKVNGGSRGKRPKMRTIELSISKSNLDAQVAQFLYAMGVVFDDEEVKDIQYKFNGGDIVPLKIRIEKEVKVFRSD